MAPESGTTSLAVAHRRDPLTLARQEAPATWSWTPPPSSGECPHGLSDPAWCGICTPPARTRGRARR
jgi:hypothetical protein